MANIYANGQLKMPSSIDCPQTPPKYNGGQLSIDSPDSPKSYLFNVDKLILHCRHGIGSGLLHLFDFDDVLEHYQSMDVVLIKDKKTGNGTSRYKYGFDVLFDNQSVGLLLIEPRTILKNGSQYDCSFKVHNHLFYQKAWTMIIGLTLDQLGVTVNNISNLDIACDGHGFISDYSLLVKGFYKNVGRSTHRPAEMKQDVIKGFYIGKRISDKCMSGYLKSNEIKRSNKKYISDYWANNNLQGLDSVERLELRLKSKILKGIVKNSKATVVSFLDRLDDQIFIASLFKSQIDGYYQFVLASDLERDSKVTRHNKIDVVDWTKVTYDKIDKMKKVKKPSSVWGAKQRITWGLKMIHAGYYPSKNLFENEEYQRLLLIAEEYQIVSWFNSLVKRIEKRDKAQIAEMKYNRMEINAGGRSIYYDKYH
jgi:hypothetical protein